MLEAVTQIRRNLQACPAGPGPRETQIVPAWLMKDVLYELSRLQLELSRQKEERSFIYGEVQ